jgi:hypothetical protein
MLGHSSRCTVSRSCQSSCHHPNALGSPTRAVRSSGPISASRLALPMSGRRPDRLLDACRGLTRPDVHPRFSRAIGMKAVTPRRTMGPFPRVAI